MSLAIPTGVRAKYKEVIDATISTDMFGVVCQLVFVEKREVVSNTFDAPTVNNLHAHMYGMGPTQFKRDDKTYKEVEVTENITIKVYWESKDFQKPTKDFVVPDNAIQIIGYQSDLPKIREAKAFIPLSGNSYFAGQRYKLYKEPFPVGIGKDRYFAAFMERI